MQRFVVNFAVWLLKKDLSLENKAKLLNSILHNLRALPLRSIISVSENGSLVIRDKELDREEMNILKESASALKDNRVFNLIQDEVLFRAFNFGVNHSTNFDQIYASKMAVWWGQEENKLIKLIAGDPDPLG